MLQEAGFPGDLGFRHGQPHVWEAREEGVEGDLPLEARQWRSHADVDAFAEGDVPVGVLDA